MNGKNNTSISAFVLVFVMVLNSIVFSNVAVAKQTRSRSKESKVIDERSVSAPQDQEVCFSPDEPCDVKLIKFAQSAQKSIDVAIYDINLDKLVHELLVASRKIPVRIVVDRRQAKGEHSLVPLLIKAGAQVRYGRQRGIMHNKFMIVDHKRVELGSFNYTNHASIANNENQIYLSNPVVVERYNKRFEEIWSKAAPN